jgi:hypothetical protein
VIPWPFAALVVLLAYAADRRAAARAETHALMRRLMRGAQTKETDE